MSQSKRKRGQDESGRPSKKKSVEHVAETVKFSCIEEVGEWSPVIGRICIVVLASIRKFDFE